MFLLFQGLLSIWGFGFLPCQHTINYASTPPSAHQPIAAHGYASTPPSAHQPIAAHGYTSTPPSAHQPNTTVVALVVRPKVHATIELTASQCHWLCPPGTDNLARTRKKKRQGWFGLNMCIEYFLCRIYAYKKTHPLTHTHLHGHPRVQGTGTGVWCQHVGDCGGFIPDNFNKFLSDWFWHVSTNKIK